MRVGDILYFAPGISFGEVDMDGLRLPEQFRNRIVGLYLDPARACAQHGFAFAAGVLLVTCIDALARFKYGGRGKERFKKFVNEELQSFSEPDLAARFYEEYRNGLVHEARLKNGAQFSLDTDRTVKRLDGVLLINPRHLVEETREAVDSLVDLLTANDRVRKVIVERLKRDLEAELRVSRV